MSPVPRTCADCRPSLLAAMGIAPRRRRTDERRRRVSLRKPTVWATAWRDGGFFSTLEVSR